jgi:hypothetical protein
MAHTLLIKLSVTFKIETERKKNGTCIKLIGWLRSEYLAELRAKIWSSAHSLVLGISEGQPKPGITSCSIQDKVR